jgi:hypothetical protein
MESLSLMQQFALLLLGIALSLYMWGTSRTVAAVIIVVTSFGILFYAFIIISATLFYYCPFQTPLSLILRHLMSYIRRSPLWLDSHAHLYLESISTLVSSCMRRVKLWSMIPFVHSSTQDQSLRPEIEPLFGDLDVDFAISCASNRLDAHCLMWMRDSSTDPDVTMAAMQFIPEVEWSAAIDVVPSLYQLATQLQEHYNLMNMHPATIPSTKNKAYATAKAFLHLYVQRRFIEGPVTLKDKDFNYRPALTFHPAAKDLESTLSMMHHIAVDPEWPLWWRFNRGNIPSALQISSFSRIVLYHLFASNRDGISETSGLDGFLEDLWLRSISLPLSTIANGMLICGLTLGLRIHERDLSVTDKR